MEIDRKVLEESKRVLEIKLIEVQNQNIELRNELSSIKNNTDLSLAVLSSSVSSKFFILDEIVSKNNLDLTSNLSTTSKNLNDRVDDFSKAINNHNCHEIATDCQDDGGGVLTTLFKHQLNCPLNEFLTSWRMNRCSTKSIQVVGFCCRIN